jgi:hypothetical protein
LSRANAILRKPALALLLLAGLVSPVGAAVAPFETPIVLRPCASARIPAATGHLVVDGRCDSACTVFMGIIPVIASA